SVLPDLPGRPADSRRLRLSEGLPSRTAGARYPRPPDPRRHERNHACHRGAPGTRERSRSAMSDPVIFQEIPAAGDRRVGVASLNSPQTLNGLSLAMCETLTERLDAWARDPAIVAVLLKGEGEKAFCAGGDLHGIYRGML